MGETFAGDASPWRRLARRLGGGARTGERDRAPADGSTSGRRWAWSFGVATAAGVFLGLVGPFGSYLNGGRWIVVAYWVAALWAGALLFGLTLPLALAQSARRRVPRPVAVGVATALTAAPLALICRIGAQALWPGPIGRIGGLAWYAQTLIISVPFAAGFVWITRPPTPSLEQAQTRGSARGFLSRLPARLGRELVALQMEDHYVRAHTRLGSALVLIPLYQAIEELGDLAGLKVHRSWWVADAGVEGAARDGRNVRLKLAAGIEAPVARSAVAGVRARGWLRAVD